MVEIAPSLAQLFSASVFRILLGCSVSKVSTHSCITDTSGVAVLSRLATKSMVLKPKFYSTAFLRVFMEHSNYLLVVSGY